ncbi:MAG: restriction endonuclease subunit S [Defluviitaleaceae bacterium]|nr:restriction endonuclease subunit S [Defluviitaleaceae bacterium]
MTNMPEIRFKGFTDAWTQRKLGEVVEKLKSYSLSRDVETNDATGYRYIHYGDIHKQVADMVTRDEQLPNIKIGNYIPIAQGDLVLADASEDYTGIAEPCVVLHTPKDKIIAGLHTIAIRPIDTNPLFLYHLFHTDGFKKFGSHVGTGLKVFGITFTNLAQYDMKAPTLPEQTAIGSFFRTLDDIIHATQRKVALLKQLKTAYLQQMFPQDGERVPRVRFAGFAGDWEIRTIESFADVKTGGKDTQDAISDGEYDFYVRSPKIEKINSYSFDGEAVLTVGDGVGVGKVFHYVNGKFDYHQRVYKISDFNDVYGLFFYQYFATNFIKESQKYNAKTSVDSVRREMITKMLIPCPAIEEQITIGDFFHNLDTQITTQSEKAEKLKQLKSAYLQKMFT